MLVELGYLARYDEDRTTNICGKFGDRTEIAVNGFKDKFLPNGNIGYNRGVVGPTTWDKLKEEVAKKNMIGPQPWNGEQCFTAETIVDAEGEHQAISSIKIADMVYSENPETGEKGLKKVTQVFERETKLLVHVTMGDKTINTTRRHPFYVEGKGWVKARELQAGDKLHMYENGTVEITGIKEEFLIVPVKVYNFEVEDWHSYCVSELDVLVHNCGN